MGGYWTFQKWNGMKWTHTFLSFGSVLSRLREREKGRERKGEREIERRKSGEKEECCPLAG